MNGDRTDDLTDQSHKGHAHAGGSHHGWMMIACCIPMVLIAVLLVATGTAGPGFLFVAFACTAMMALMMRGMNHGLDDDGDQSTHTPWDEAPIASPTTTRSRR